MESVKELKIHAKQNITNTARNSRERRLGNRGSTFIVVIVAVSFLAVLGTVIIAVSAANVQMKNLEYVSTRNFYADERVLDDVYHGIGKVASDYLARSYTEVLARIDATGAAEEYEDQQAAFNAFSQSFVIRLMDLYGNPGTSATSATATPNTLSMLQSYITVRDPSDPSNPVITLESFREVEIIDVDGEQLSRDDIIDSGAVPYQYIFQDLVVNYLETDASGASTGFESTITTDIVIEVPFVNFYQDSTRILDYAMIANRGIYFSNATAAPAQVFGNVYAGISNEESERNLETYFGVGSGSGGGATDAAGVYGGLNFHNANVIFRSNYLVSKGDMNLRQSSVEIGRDLSEDETNVWVESIRTLQQQNRQVTVDEGSDLIIHGDIYVANDLELNADNSNVTLTGNYYGYNKGSYMTWENKGVRADSYQEAIHTYFSSMLINGNDCVLDISGLDTLMLAGLAYVDFATRPAGSAYQPLPRPDVDTGIGEYATGESLAVRANQFIYLAPSDCLSVTNPIRVSDIPTDGSDIWIRDTVSNPWFGTKGFVDGSSPLVERDVVVREGGSNVIYRYYYLNFISPEAQARYANMILNMPIPADSVGIPAAINGLDADLQGLYTGFTALELLDIWNIRKSLDGRIKATGIRVADAVSNGARIYTQGAMTTVEAGESSGPLVPLSQQMTVDYADDLSANIHKHYIALYEQLDPMEGSTLTGDVPANALIIPGAMDDDSYTLDQSVTSEYPVRAFVNLVQLSTAGRGGAITSYRDSAYNSQISSNGPIEVNMDFNGIIICGGDVIINNGVTVNGLIIAAGRIYVNGNVTIQANRGMVQTILDEELEIESQNGAGRDVEPNADFAVTYLEDIQVVPAARDENQRVRERIRGTDYTDFISYEDWRRG